MGLLTAVCMGAKAQSALYPKHFDLQEVTLTDGPMKTAMDKNIELLMKYDVDRLLTPYVRQAGLGTTTDAASPYYQWLTKHPNFTNWGDASFDLSGHVGGHYLSALALAYAACHDEAWRSQLKQRMDYMLQVMKDCQDAYDGDTSGLEGFIGGQPINDSWRALYRGDLSKIRGNWGWVPFYCQHKILAGLRDAYVYGGSLQARDMFRKLCDWSISVVSKVSDADLQSFLDCEHGGMNESLADAYQLFGDEKYLTAAKRYTHQTMVNGLQTLATSFLDGKHANTQVPKYIGMERIYELDGTQAKCQKAAENFWADVALNRTTCIGGNSVSEHFLARANANRYIDVLDGPESCNTNNMLKLTEMLSDRTADARYADFYEQAVWNHILSTQDPETGGYVYFTTLRPQGYRVYSQVNQAMWCCVGTGMENHSKYGHFIYTHDADKTLYVNLFTPSELNNETFGLTQATIFPFIDPSVSAVPTPQTTVSRLTITKGGNYTLAVRHPAWVGEEYYVSVNGTPVATSVEKGKASYVNISREWKSGDVVLIHLPMELSYEECPGYGDYIAFKFGPILLAAKTSQDEKLPNEYAGAGRMDHAPGSVASSKNLTTAPLLIGERADVLSRIKPVSSPDKYGHLQFTIDASRPGVESYRWETLTLQPFYQIHHARYSCYWYQQTEEAYKASTMAQTEAANEALMQRTLDFVAPGEQQSEAGHEYNYSSDSSTGSYNGESYRDTQRNGHIQYSLFNKEGVTSGLSVMLRFTTADAGRMGTLTVDGVKIADITVASSVKGAVNGFYNAEFPIPASLAVDAKGQAKEKFVVRLTASPTTPIPGLYYMRLMSGYEENANSYHFVASDWTTGDANRVAAQNITYDKEQNIIHVKASGQNNVALMLRYNDLDYTIDANQKFLVVRAANLKTADGDSYLWWLNGSNHGTQVAPTVVHTVAIGDQPQQVIAWDMSQSGLYENFTGDRPSVCAGMTIFGLTSATGQADIYDINFVEDIDLYVRQATAVGAARLPATGDGYYTLGGAKAAKPRRGVYVNRGKKVVM